MNLDLKDTAPALLDTHIGESVHMVLVSETLGSILEGKQTSSCFGGRRPHFRFGLLLAIPEASRLCCYISSFCFHWCHHAVFWCAFSSQSFYKTLWNIYCMCTVSYRYGYAYEKSDCISDGKLCYICCICIASPCCELACGFCSYLSGESLCHSARRYRVCSSDGFSCGYSKWSYD